MYAIVGHVFGSHDIECKDIKDFFKRMEGIGLKKEDLIIS
jgi:hypothetical protein